jgi:hypothetical protein
MNNKILLMVMMITAIFCSGCGSSDSQSAASGGTSTQSASQNIIDNEDLTPGLKGVDANNNGIRDDIDRLIAQKYSTTPTLKKAAEQEARALQKSMEATNRMQSLIAGDEIMRAGACISKALPEHTKENEKILITLPKEIAALTANTKERFTAYWKSEELGGGAVYEEPQEPVCD